MNLNKEQWEKIKQEIGITSSYGRVELLIDGVKITLVKQFVKENRLCIAVYRNGFLSLKGCFERDNDFDNTVINVHRKRSVSLYTAKEKARLIKAFGTREAKKLYSLDKVSIWYEPYFPTFGSLKASYKKIENIELICIGYSS